MKTDYKYTLERTPSRRGYFIAVQTHEGTEPLRIIIPKGILESHRDVRERARAFCARDFMARLEGMYQSSLKEGGR